MSGLQQRVKEGSLVSVVQGVTRLSSTLGVIFMVGPCRCRVFWQSGRGGLTIAINRSGVLVTNMPYQTLVF